MFLNSPDSRTLQFPTINSNQLRNPDDIPVLFSYVQNCLFMSKIRVECGVCGSIYGLTSKIVQRMDSGTIHCSVCNHIIFEYSEFKTWYPFLIVRKENHKNPGRETGS